MFVLVTGLFTENHIDIEHGTGSFMNKITLKTTK